MRSGRSAFIVTWIYILYSTLVTIAQQSQIESSKFMLFALAKALIVGLAIPGSFYLRRNPRSTLGHVLVAISIAIYPAYNQWFLINYEFALFEMILAFALVYRPARWLFISTSVCGAILWCAVYGYRYDFLKAQLHEPAPRDGFLTVGAFTLLALAVYFYFNYERSWREAALGRFGLIGQHAASIIHDVKNLVATPLVQVETLQRKLGPSVDPEVKEILSDLHSSLASTSRMIFDLNQMARLAEKQATRFSVKDVASEVCELLKNKLKEIEVSIEHDFEILADRALLYSVFLNLFLNSIDQFSRPPRANAKISIELKARTVFFCDNAGGFDPSVLTQLLKGRAGTTKTRGSGLGLFLVANAVTELGGRTDFRNVKDGALVEIAFS